MEHPSQSFKLEVHIDDDVYKKLKEANVKLCLLKSFRSAFPQCKLTPTAWICTADFTQNNTITWKEEYEAFTAEAEVEKDHKLEVIKSYPLQNHQAFVINSKKGSGIIDPQFGGFGEGLKIANSTGSSFHLGLAQKAQFNGVDLPMTPVCAQKDKNFGCNIITPLLFVIVTFAPSNIEPGTIVKKTWDYVGIFVHMAEDERGVQYIPIAPEDEDIRVFMKGSERWISWPKEDEDWARNVSKQAFLPHYLLQYAQTSDSDDEDTF